MFSVLFQVCCKCCPTRLIFSFSFWSDFSRLYTPTLQGECAFLDIFSTVYCLQHAVLKQYAGWREPWNLRNSESSVRQYFFVQLCQKKSNDFSHWLLSFTPWTFPYICWRLISWSTFSLDTDKRNQKERLPCKAESSKGFNSLSHGTFYFITFSSPRCHSQTWLIIVPHNTCKKWLNFLFQHPQGKMWCCRIRLSCITYHYKIETTSQLVLLLTRAF